MYNLDKNKINEETPKKDAATNTLWEKERNPAKSLTTTGSRPVDTRITQCGRRFSRSIACSFFLPHYP